MTENPARQSDQSDQKEWTAVADPPSTSEAEIIRATLGFAGIPAMLSGETGLAAAYGLGGNGVPTLVPVLVLVPADRFDEARQVLDEARAAGKLRPDGSEDDTEVETDADSAV